MADLKVHRQKRDLNQQRLDFAGQNVAEQRLRKGAGERVAAFLLKFSDRCTRGQEMDLPMSRADIADYLGLTIETVSRSFSEMERTATIDLPSSRHVVLRNRSALVQLQAA